MRRLILVTLLFASSLSAQSLPCLHQGTWGARGNSRDFLVSGDRVYAADGRGVTLYDISKPSMIRVLSSRETNRPSNSVQQAGDGIAVLTENHIDFFDADLNLRQGIDVNARRVAGNDQILVSAGETLTLFGVGASTLKQLSSIQLMNQITALGVSGRLVFLTQKESFTDVYDTSSGSLRRVATLPLNASSFVTAGNYVLAISSGIINFIDTSTPIPSTVGRLDFPESLLQGGAVTGNTLFVVDRFTSLVAVDFFNPANPRVVGSAPMPLRAVAASGDILVTSELLLDQNGFTAETSEPLNVYRTRAAGIQKLGSFHDYAGPLAGVAIDGRYAYVADAPMFRVIDLATPSRPREVASIYLGDFSDRVQLRDRTVIVFGRGNVHMIDVTSPVAPRQTGIYRGGGIPRSGAGWAGPYLLEANKATGFHVLDVTDPTHPGFITGLKNDSLGAPTGVLAALPTAVYIGVTSGIKVANLADPHHATVAGLITGAVTDAQIVPATNSHSALLALADIDSLRIFDLTTPASPVEISSLPFPKGGTESVSGDLIYLTNPRGDLNVISVANPAQPRIVYSGSGLNSPVQPSVAAGLMAIADTYSLKVFSDPITTAGTCSNSPSSTSNMVATDPSLPSQPGRAPQPTEAPVDVPNRTAGPRLVVPGVGAVLGGNGTHWESDLRILCKRDCAMTLDYIPFGVNSPAKRVELTAKQGELIVAPDVVRSLFATDSTNGMVEIRSDALDDISASATTLNRGGSGAYGERIPARRLQPAVAGKSQQILPGVRQDASARTNIGIIETTGQPHALTLELLDDNGSVVTFRNVELEGFQSLQTSLPGLFPGLETDFTGVLRIDGSDSTVFYASRVDQQTGDFVFTYASHVGEVTPISGDDSVRFLPAAGSTPGANNSTWRTALQLTNVSTAPATLLLTFIPSVDPGAAVTRRVDLNSFASADSDDLFDTWFPTLPATLIANGSLRIESASPFTGWSRIYNQSAAGTFGQAVPLLDRSPARTAAASTNQEKRARPNDETKPISFAQMFALSEDSAHRSNLGLLETAGKDTDVTIRFFDRDGALLRSTDRHVDAGASLALIGILRGLGLQGTSEVRAEIEQTGGEGSVTLFGSVVDQVTGDGVFATGE